MSGQITHSWNGTVLTITSDAGTSSMDLRGDTGCRGPQGPHGIVYDAEGNIVMEGFATEEYVDHKFENLELDGYATEIFVDAAIDAALVDIDGYATEEYVDTQIMNVATGGSIDMSKYATKDYVDEATANADIKVDGTTIVKNADGTISATLGGGVYDSTIINNTYSTGTTLNDVYRATYITSTTEADFPIDSSTVLTFVCTYADGVKDIVTFTCHSDAWAVREGDTFTLNVLNSDLTYINRLYGTKTAWSNGKYTFRFIIVANDGAGYNEVSRITLSIGYDEALGYQTIDANLIPVDGETIIIQNGKLTVVGGTSLASSEEVYY